MRKKSKETITGIICIAVGLLFILIIHDLFQSGLATLILGLTGALVAASGAASGIMLITRRGPAGITIRSFSITGILFVLLLAGIRGADHGFFIGFIVVWVLLLFYSAYKLNIDAARQIIQVNRTTIPGTLLILHPVVKLYAIALAAALLIIWIPNWEEMASLIPEPNGEGSRTYAGSADSPRIRIDTAGGFVYRVESAHHLGLTESRQSEDPYRQFASLPAPRTDDPSRQLGTITIKLTAPEAEIRLLPLETGLLDIGILNSHLSETIILADGEPILSTNPQIADQWLQPAENGNPPAIGFISNIDVLTGSHARKFSVRVERDQPLLIEVRRQSTLPGLGKSRQELDFFVLSDPHSNFRTLIPLLHTLTIQQPDFIVINGDLVNNGYGHEYTAMAALLETLPIPVFTTMGNHDIWNRSADRYHAYFGPEIGSFSIGDTAFLTLNSSTGYLGEAQLSWITSRLEETREQRIIVLTHMSPIDTVLGRFDDSRQINPELNNSIHSRAESDYLTKLFDSRGVDLVLAGHSHIHGISQIGTTRYITGGSTGGTVLAGEKMSYLRVRSSAAGIMVENIDLPGTSESLTAAKLTDTARVFAIPFFINRSIRIFLTLLLLYAAKLGLIGLKKRYIIVSPKRAMPETARRRPAVKAESLQKTTTGKSTGPQSTFHREADGKPGSPVNRDIPGREQ